MVAGGEDYLGCFLQVQRGHGGSTGGDRERWAECIRGQGKNIAIKYA